MSEFNMANRKKAFSDIFDHLSMHDINVDTNGGKTIIEYIPAGYGISDFKIDLSNEIINVCHNLNGWLIEEFNKTTIINDTTNFQSLFDYLFKPGISIVHP